MKKYITKDEPEQSNFIQEKKPISCILSSPLTKIYITTMKIADILQKAM